MLREAARVFARLLQRVLVERLVVGLLTGVSALCRFGRLGLGGRDLLGHAPSISAPCGASSCPVRGAFRHEKGHPCGWPGSTFWSGRRDSNPHGRCPRAPEARASAISPRPDVIKCFKRTRTLVKNRGPRPFFQGLDRPVGMNDVKTLDSPIVYEPLGHPDSDLLLGLEPEQAQVHIPIPVSICTELFRSVLQPVSDLPEAS